MAENYNGAPGSREPGVTFPPFRFNFNVNTHPTGERSLTVEVLWPGYKVSFPMSFDGARAIYEAWGRALQAEHVDIVANGHDKLWSPGDPDR